MQHYNTIILSIITLVPFAVWIWYNSSPQGDWSGITVFRKGIDSSIIIPSSYGFDMIYTVKVHITYKNVQFCTVLYLF